MNEIVDEARTWIGTPWQHQQRMKGVACDCAGLPIGVAKTLNRLPADMEVTGYDREPDGVTLMAHCRRWMQEISVADIGPGNVVVMRDEEYKPRHIGIVADYRHGGLSIIHAHDKRGRHAGVVEEHRIDSRWRAMMVAAFVMPEVLA